MLREYQNTDKPINLDALHARPLDWPRKQHPSLLSYKGSADEAGPFYEQRELDDNKR